MNDTEKEQTKFTVQMMVIAGLILGWLVTTGVKTQWVRLLDIILLGPFLIWLAFKVRKPKIVKLLLAFFGSTTISYNLRNYNHERKAKEWF